MTEPNIAKERIARTIYGLYPQVQPWDGEPYAYDQPEAYKAKERAEDAAEAVFGEFEALLLETKRQAWELAVKSIRYPDGTAVPVQENINPFEQGRER